MSKAKQSMLALVMLLAALLAYALTPRIYTADSNRINLAAMVPIHFADWQQVEMQGVVVNPEVDVQLSKVYAQTLARVYVNGQGQRIMLSIAYSRDQRQSSGQQTHRPELCYPAQGFSLQDKRHQMLRLGGYSLPVNRMVALREQRVEPLTYWITINNRVDVDSGGRKLAQVKSGLAGYILDGMIFRVSSIGDDVAAGLALQADFIAKLYAAQSPAVRSHFFGREQAL